MSASPSAYLIPHRAILPYVHIRPISGLSRLNNLNAIFVGLNRMRSISGLS